MIFPRHIRVQMIQLLLLLCLGELVAKALSDYVAAAWGLPAYPCILAQPTHGYKVSTGF